MFTSRAEHRLALRHDTCDARLSPKARGIGLLDDARWERFARKAAALDEIRELLSRRKCPKLLAGAPPAGESEAAAEAALLSRSGESLERCLADARVAPADLFPFAPELGAYPAEWLESVRLDIRYSGYIEKEKRAAAKAAKIDAVKLDPALDYAALAGLSSEAREKLGKVKPLTVGQAARVPGVRQGDVALLMVLAGRR